LLHGLPTPPQSSLYHNADQSHLRPPRVVPMVWAQMLLAYGDVVWARLRGCECNTTR
jgi:hypothetical protein